VQAIGRPPQQAPDGAPVHYERHRPGQTRCTAWCSSTRPASSPHRTLHRRRVAPVHRGRVRRFPAVRPRQGAGVQLQSPEVLPVVRREHA